MFLNQIQLEGAVETKKTNSMGKTCEQRNIKAIPKY